MRESFSIKTILNIFKLHTILEKSPFFLNIYSFYRYIFFSFIDIEKVKNILNNIEYKPIGKTNVRRLTPLECERLQTLPDNYTEGISDTNRYKCIGNGWTVDVIAWIFKDLKKELDEKQEQEEKHE